MAELFIDGGATATAVVTAVAGWMGFKRSERDKEELVTKPHELDELRDTLQNAHAKVQAAHEAATNIWRNPLSLFGERQEKAAAAKGIPAWAINSVHKAGLLVEEATSLGIHAGEYETQLEIARAEMVLDGEGALLQRAPVRRLIEQLEDLAPKLTAHTAFLAAARETFDSHISVEGVITEDYLTNEERGLLVRVRNADFPEKVLRKRDALGKIFELPEKTLKRVARELVANSNVDSKMQIAVITNEPSDRKAQLESLRGQLQSESWGTRCKAVEHLGELGCKAAVPDLCKLLVEDESNIVKEMVVISLGLLGDARAERELCQALRDPYLRRTAATSLQKLANPVTAPLIFAALQDDERTIAALLDQHAKESA